MKLFPICRFVTCNTCVHIKPNLFARICMNGVTRTSKENHYHHWTGRTPIALNTLMTTCITEVWKTASHHPLWCMFYFTITNWCFYVGQESLKTGVTYPFHFRCLQEPATPKAEAVLFCMAANLNLQNIGPLKAIEKSFGESKLCIFLSFSVTYELKNLTGKCRCMSGLKTNIGSSYRTALIWSKLKFCAKNY